MMEKILVTGGAGFIGSEFVRQGVERGCRLVVVDKLTYAGDLERIDSLKGEIVFYRVCITDNDLLESLFEKEKPDAIVHWAAESHVDRSILDSKPFLESNIKGTHALLELAKKHEIKLFVNISTDEVYGDLMGAGRFCETSPLIPNSPYSVSKASADMLGRAYFRTYGLPVITVRPSNTYGPWQYPEKLVPLTIFKAMNNRKIPIYGTGKNRREWIFVSDCVRAIFLILEKGRAGEIYNIGSGEEKENMEVVKAILELLNKNENLIEYVPDRLGHDYKYALNSEKLKEQIGFVIKTKFGKGIKETVEWYLQNKDWLKGKIN